MSIVEHIGCLAVILLIIWTMFESAEEREANKERPAKECPCKCCSMLEASPNGSD